jgi:uncharacterized membrane protein YczE
MIYHIIGIMFGLFTGLMYGVIGWALFANRGMGFTIGCIVLALGLAITFWPNRENHRDNDTCDF